MRKSILVLLVGMWCSSLSTQAETSGSFEYTVNANTVTITGFHCDMADVEIPATIAGLPVVAIGEAAFDSCSSLQSLIVPDSVTLIDFSAFINCQNLASVTIGSGVKTIENQAFQNCNSLATLTIERGVTIIGAATFKGCTSLGTLVLPDSVNQIRTQAFNGCSGLTSVTLSENLWFIGLGAFEDCLNLASISIPDSVTSLGSRTFGNCQSLATVELGEGLTSISDFAFDKCSSLTTVLVPATIESVGFNSFANCTSLTEIYFLGRPPEFGPNVFQGSNQSLVVNYLDGVPGWDGTTLDVPTAGTDPEWLWGRYLPIVDGAETWARTTYWMGWLEISLAPWIWEPISIFEGGLWHYMPEGVPTRDEGWFYMTEIPLDDPKFMLILSPGSDWGYSFQIHKWLYLRPEVRSAAEGWVYMPYHFNY